jgi:DNA-binding transcriptional LysR family regulator
VSPLSEIARFVPGLQVQMVEESQSKLIEMIYDGEINAALTAGPEPLPERIDQWVLFDERLLVMAAPTINGRHSRVSQLRSSLKPRG